MNPLITITKDAELHIQKMLTEKNGLGFRLSIKKTGCSGYAYVPALIEKVETNDLHFVTESGLAVYVDPQCESLVKNLVIDYVVEEGHGLKQKRLVFINPNEKNRCGCGESFTIE